ncbi:MAG TPA: hypothetical protein VF017_02765 [Thermoanaerobaculia bacterium]|nr:hypothetical protein [Thermoanaerobaculia bacterium]
MSLVDQRMMRPALIGGAALGVASAIPFLNCLNCACCALVIAGGMLAAYLYFKDMPAPASPPYGDAALLGALTGIFGAVISTIVQLPFTFLMSGMNARSREQIEQMMSRDEVPEALKGVLNMMASSGAGTVAGVLIGLAFSLVLFSIFAMIGALIYVAAFGKKGQPMPPAPPPVTPMPPEPPPAPPTWQQ